jgi:hypothetical protein
MRLHILSDLHQEFGEVPVPRVDCDCVVLAGDVSTKTNGLKWILRTFTDVPVIYLCGNHEYYGENYPSLLDKLRDMAHGTNVHVLENESVTIGGVRIFGCTLWTDMALMGDWQIGCLSAGAVMNDYKRATLPKATNASPRATLAKLTSPPSPQCVPSSKLETLPPASSSLTTLHPCSHCRNAGAPRRSAAPMPQIWSRSSCNTSLASGFTATFITQTTTASPRPECSQIHEPIQTNRTPVS